MKRQTIIVMLLLSIIAAGCRQEEPKEQQSLKEIYENISNLASQSLFFHTREGYNKNGIALPTITEADMQYLASLTPEQLETERQRLYTKIGAERFKQIEQKKAANLAKKYDLLRGHRGLDSLKAFAIEYLKSKGGWDEISRLLPPGLSREQAQTYVGVAIYIDRIARPFCQFITNQNMSTRNSTITIWNADGYSEGFCLGVLQDLFAGAGLDIDAGAFVAAMGNHDGDGASTDYDLIDYDGNSEAFDAAEYWNQYKMCRDTPNHNGRE